MSNLKNCWYGYGYVTISRHENFVVVRISRPAAVVVEERISHAEWNDLVKAIDNESKILREAEA